MWKDPQLSWEPHRFGNVTEIRLPVDRIWTPYIVLHNKYDLLFRVVLSSSESMVARWRSSKACDDAISRSWVQFPQGQNCITTLGKLAVSVTKQYNLALFEGRWRSSAGKVIAGLAESNGNLLDQLRAQRSVKSLGELYLSTTWAYCGVCIAESRGWNITLSCLTLVYSFIHYKLQCIRLD